MFSVSVTARGKLYAYDRIKKMYFRFVGKNVKDKLLEKKLIITLF